MVRSFTDQADAGHTMLKSCCRITDKLKRDEVLGPERRSGNS
jgi:hypothetical protein